MGAPRKKVAAGMRSSPQKIDPAGEGRTGEAGVGETAVVADGSGRGDACPPPTQVDRAQEPVRRATPADKGKAVRGEGGGSEVQVAGAKRPAAEAGLEGAAKKQKAPERVVVWDVDPSDSLFGSTEQGRKAVLSMAKRLPLPKDREAIKDVSIPEAAALASYHVAQGLSFLMHAGRQAGSVAAVANNRLKRIDELEAGLVGAQSKEKAAEERAARAEEARAEASRKLEEAEAALEVSRASTKKMEAAVLDLSKAYDAEREKSQARESAHVMEMEEFKVEIQGLKTQLVTARFQAVESFKKSAEYEKSVRDAAADQYTEGFDRAVRRGRKHGLDMTHVEALFEDSRAEDSEEDLSDSESGSEGGGGQGPGPQA